MRHTLLARLWLGTMALAATGCEAILEDLADGVEAPKASLDRVDLHHAPTVLELVNWQCVESFGTDALSPSPAKPISFSSASSGNASLLSKKPEPRNANDSGGADTPVASRAPRTFASCVRSSLIWIPNAAARSSSMPSSWRGGSIMPLSSVCSLRFGPRYERCCGVSWR